MDLTFGLHTRVQEQTLAPLIRECLVRVRTDGGDPVNAQELTPGLEPGPVLCDELGILNSGGSQVDLLGEQGTVEGRGARADDGRPENAHLGRFICLVCFHITV